MNKYPPLYSQQSPQNWHQPSSIPPVPPKTSFWRRKVGRFPMWLIVGAIGLCATISLVNGITTGGKGIGANNSAQNEVPKQVTHAAAPTRAPAATQQISIADNLAVLGGTISAFDKKIGSNNCCQYDGWSAGNTWVGVYTAENGDNWYQAVGEQSNERVVGIVLQLYNTTLSTNTPVWSNIQAAEKACNAYLPPDAQLIKSLSDKEYEYYSSLLAHTLSSKDFTDANGHIEKSGLFFTNYDYYNDSSQIDYCELATDGSFQRETVPQL